MKRVGLKAFGFGIIGLGLIVGGIQLASADEGGKAEKGKALFEAKKCAMCHAIGGKGGKMGPDLSDVGGKQTQDWLAKFLKDPKGTKPGAKMPAVKGTDEELDAIAGYLATLKGSK